MAYEGSQLKTYCIGIVAVDKPRGTDIVKFFPVEGLSFEEGDPKDNKETMNVVISDASGTSKKSNTNRGSVLEARWFSDGSDGRQTPPDVINGETVRIYKFGDSEVFYWKTMYREPEIRRKEHVVFAYGNLPSGRTAWDLDSTYGNMWSTHDKKIWFWTSTSDGETFKYDFTIDTMNNYYETKDDIGNAFGFLSAPHHIFMKNATGSLIQFQEALGHLRADTGIKHDTPVSHFSGSVKVDGSTDVHGHLAAGDISTGGIVAGGYGFGGPSFGVAGVSAPGDVVVPERRVAMMRAAPAGINDFESPSAPLQFNTPDAIFTGNITILGNVYASNMGSNNTRMAMGPMSLQTQSEVSNDLIQGLMQRIDRLEQEIETLKNK